MTVNAPLSILAIVILGAAPAISTNARVFLIAGQSNSVGLNSDGFTAEDTSSDRIFQLSCCSNGGTLPVEQCGLIVATDPLHHQCDNTYLGSQTLGFGMSFARELLPNLEADDMIVLVPSGFSGTGFFDNVWTAYTGSGFTSAVAKLKRAFELLTGLNMNPTFEGILWHQGEHDAGDNGAGNVADTNFYLYQDIIPMINAFRDTNLLPFTSTSLPFVCANLLPSWVSDPAHPVRLGVWTAIALLGQEVPYSACAPSQGLLGDPVYLSGLDGEVIHFTGRAQRILGRRYYAAWLLAKYNKPE